ncbi:MAG: RNA-binding cell elongation regulator Jag/EloR, partial [Spirochaetota bacterium]
RGTYMKVIEVEGKSIDEAVRKAADTLGVHFSMIRPGDVEVLDEGKSGIFGFGVSRSAKIRVSYSFVANDIGETAKEVTETLLDKMGIGVIIKEVNENESKVYIELESDNSGLIIGKKGKTLEAVQFIINMMVSQKTHTDKKIIIDIEAYRSKREKALKKLSEEVAEKVSRTGKPFSMEPMNPFERRLVHMTLQDHEHVMTKSEGQGAFRKVKVYPRTMQE